MTRIRFNTRLAPLRGKTLEVNEVITPNLTNSDCVVNREEELHILRASDLALLLKSFGVVRVSGNITISVQHVSTYNEGA